MNFDPKHVIVLSESLALNNLERKCNEVPIKLAQI